MSIAQTQNNSVLVDTPDSVPEHMQGIGDAAKQRVSPDQQAVAWVMSRVNPWEQHRDQQFSRRWKEYWRLWRGMWSEDDKNRQSERSRLIAPALSQAIDQQTAEVMESFFGKDVWLDIADTVPDDSKESAEKSRDQLLADFDEANIEEAVAEAGKIAAITGTAIIKLDVQVKAISSPTRDQSTGKLSASGTDKVLVVAEAIRPDNFIPDPSGRTIDEMLGCAHRVARPFHTILEKIDAGVYLESARKQIMPQHAYRTGYEIDASDPGVLAQASTADSIDIIEWHGKLPAKYIAQLAEQKTPLDSIMAHDMEANPVEGDGPLVEAIVTIANKSVLLRAIQNPFVMKDRSIIASPWEKVPGRFWGRGVAEKGYNPQKALDSELRARQDALGFISAPMLAIDAGKLPRNTKMEVYPGKTFLTQGKPSDAIEPIKMGDLNSGTFNQTDAMERMVQMGTGAFDTAGAIGQQSQSGSNSLSANSQLMSAFMKRAKLAIKNLDRNLLQPMVKKAMWRYMQFAPRRYVQDYHFQVKTGVGIVAREVEAMQLTQLLGMVGDQFPGVSLLVVQGIIENTALPNKTQILAAIQQAAAPPSPEVQAQQKALKDAQFKAALAQAQTAQLQNGELIAKTRKILTDAQASMHKMALEDEKVMQEYKRIATQVAELDIQQQNVILEHKRLHIMQQQVDNDKNKVTNSNK